MRVLLDKNYSISSDKVGISTYPNISLFTSNVGLFYPLNIQTSVKKFSLTTTDFPL